MILISDFGTCLKPTFLHAMTTFYRDGDSYVAFGDYVPKIFGQLFVWIVGGFFGHFLNLSPLPRLEERPGR